VEVRQESSAFSAGRQSLCRLSGFAINLLAVLISEGLIKLNLSKCLMAETLTKINPVTKAEAIAASDPYQLRPEDVIEPPRTFGATLQKIGPGIILAASVVGSGELIATTTLGAQEGFIALWLIIFSCLIKPVIQAELGRFTIATGATGLESLNTVPGPKFGVNWVVWAWAVMILCTMLQVGAMFGGVAEVLHLLFPVIGVSIWIVLLLGITLALLLRGAYKRIEWLATIKVGLFTMLTILAAVVMVRMPEHFSWDQMMTGLRLQMPGTGLATAVAVFGVTGVGASELFMYPYWCVEKGYARFAGLRDGTPEWRRRALGWIRVMHADILFSMVIYTLATLAFYFLGAGILHDMGKVPAAKDMIPILSNIYTQTLGKWSLGIFYLGAVVTLYGTIFASTAANARVYADMCRLMGFFHRDDYARRVQFRTGFTLVLTVLPVILFLVIKSPVKMVIAGGLTQAMMLPIIALSVLYLHHRKLPKTIAASIGTTILLWTAAVLIISLTGYSVVLTVKQMVGK
jgi:manganese transport protein